MTIEEMVQKREHVHEMVERAEDRGEGYEDLAETYEKAFCIVDLMLEEAIRKLDKEEQKGE